MQASGLGSDVQRMTRLLLSLSELDLRVNWLRDHFARWPVPTSAARLDLLCAQSECSDPSARQVMLAVACYFVASGETELVQELRHIAEERHLLSLGRLLGWHSPARPQSSPPAAYEVPDYGVGRELTVGERRTLARRPCRGKLERLLSDPHPLVLREVLQNPYLVESDVVRLAARRPAQPVAMEALAQSTHWLCRHRVRLAIVQNPGAPARLAVPLLSVCNRAELTQVVSNPNVPGLVRSVSRELLARRPPLARADRADQLLQ